MMQVETVTPPAQLLRLPEVPVFPGEPGDPVTEVMWSIYAARLEAAADACYANMEELRKLYLDEAP